jgi:hypothetical protein
VELIPIRVDWSDAEKVFIFSTSGGFTPFDDIKLSVAQFEAMVADAKQQLASNENDVFVLKPGEFKLEFDGKGDGNTLARNAFLQLTDYFDKEYRLYQARVVGIVLTDGPQKIKLTRFDGS